MTFTLPEELAVQFVRRVPARDRSRYVSEALAAKLAERERQLIHACSVANAASDVAALEAEFDSLPSNIAEPWDDASAR